VRKMPWLYVDGHVMDKKNIEKISIDITWGSAMVRPLFLRLVTWVRILCWSPHFLPKKFCLKTRSSRDSNLRPTATAWGSPTTAPYVSLMISVEINILIQYVVRATRCQHPIGSAVLVVKNTWTVGIYSFDLELNFATSISLSYIIRIRHFFLNFSKITLFSLMKFFCTDSILQILLMSIYLVPPKYRLEK
jgi:hypothetical protein